VSISFGTVLVAGKNLVPNPATGNTAFLIFLLMNNISLDYFKKKKSQPKRVSFASLSCVVIHAEPPKSG